LLYRFLAAFCYVFLQFPQHAVCLLLSLSFVIGL
jgi:hypothetical protein